MSLDLAQGRSAAPGPPDDGGAERYRVAQDGLRADVRHRRLRRLAVVGALSLLLLVLAALALWLGERRLTVGQIAQAVFSSDPGEGDFTVNELRMPRMLLGVLVGVAFGLAGALFQSVLRNPLASPDIIGISQGASAGAVAAILGAGLGGASVSLAAFAAGGAVAVLLYAVAWRGGMTGSRFVLAGIGVSYVCAAVVGYLLTRTEVDRAESALIWLTGSLAQATWDLVVVLGGALVVLVPLVALVRPRLSLLLLGDDQASSLGLRPEWVRLGVITLGVGLACAATAAAGPVAFVAFVSAPVARRLLGDGSLALLPSALVGAVMVVGADLVVQHVLPGDISVPVGVVTGAVGGPYLIWLMATGRSRRT